jgi:hypothetical protein
MTERERLAKMVDPHFRLRSSSPESAGRDNLALAKADRILAAGPWGLPEVTEADKALIWYASQPAEHASVDEWADWYRAEPASRSRVVGAARERAALSARQGEGA